MIGRTSGLWLLCCLWVALWAGIGCAATTRTTTPEERATAFQTLTTVESAIVIAAAAGEISASDRVLAMQQVQELRQLVADSETTPVGWSDLLQRVTNVAVQWIAHDQAKAAGPPR